MKQPKEMHEERLKKLIKLVLGDEEVRSLKT